MWTGGLSDAESMPAVFLEDAGSGNRGREPAVCGASMPMATWDLVSGRTSQTADSNAGRPRNKPGRRGVSERSGHGLLDRP